MTVPYHSILRQIAYRVGALRGTQIEGVETSYIAVPLTKAEIRTDSPVNFSTLKDALLITEGKLAQAIAETGNSPLRRYLLSQTSGIADKALVPSVDSAGKLIIGILGSVVDATDSTVCTQQPLEVVRRMSRNANSWRKCPVYYYHIDDNRIFHTRTNVKIDVCTYDGATQRVSINDNSNMLLPDTLEEALMAGSVAYIGPAPQFSNIDFASYFSATIGAIRQGMISVPSKSVSPTQAAA